MQSAKKSKRFAEAARNCKSVFFLFVDKEVYIFEDFFIAVCNCAIHSDWFIINWFIMTGNLRGGCVLFCFLPSYLYRWVTEYVLILGEKSKYKVLVSHAQTNFYCPHAV